MGKPRLRLNSWSINLEDPYYGEHPDELLTAAVEAILETAPGAYVNLVTPGEAGHPEETLLPQLNRLLEEQGIPVLLVRYIDECGCGGHVSRVYR